MYLPLLLGQLDIGIVTDDIDENGDVILPCKYDVPFIGISYDTIMALAAVLSMLLTGCANNTDDWNVVYEDRKTYIV